MGIRDSSSNRSSFVSFHGQLTNNPQSGAVIDTAGFRSGGIMFRDGSGSFGTHTFRITHSDESGGNFTEIDPDFLVGSYENIDITPARPKEGLGEEVGQVGFISSKRYVRAQMDGSLSGNPDSAVWFMLTNKIGEFSTVV